MDYLDRLEQQNEPETFHDMRPSHPMRPSWLIEAAEAADQAWRDYDAVIEAEIYSDHPNYKRIEDACNEADRISREYSRLWTQWNWERGQGILHDD